MLLSGIGGGGWLFRATVVEITRKVFFFVFSKKQLKSDRELSEILINWFSTLTIILTVTILLLKFPLLPSILGLNCSQREEGLLCCV